MYRIWLTTILFFVCRGSDQMYRCPLNLIRNQYLKTFGEKCYQFNSYEFIWSSARDTCSSRGGLLLQIRTATIQQFVMESLRSLEWNKPVWTGAYEEEFSTRWKWIEGDSLVYSNWAPGELNKCPIICDTYWECAWLQYSDGGRWHTRRCSTNSFTFICEFDMTPMKSSNTTPSAGSIPSGQQSQIVAIVLSLTVVVSIGGFVSAYIMIKRRRNNHSNQENDVTVNKRINVIRAPDPTHVEGNKISKNYASYHEIRGSPEEYEKLSSTSNPQAGPPNHYGRLTQQDSYLTPTVQATYLELCDDVI